MDLIRVFTRFPDDEACVEHLERVRWGDTPKCPHCESANVGRRNDERRIARWNCRNCRASFTVLSGTVFHKTRIPLPKWFVAISLIANARKGLSSYQLARDLDLNQKSAWRMAMQIRSAMVDQRELLAGIFEADEANVGGTSRTRKHQDDDDEPESSRSRRKSKVAEIGVMELEARDVTSTSARVAGRDLEAIIERHVARDAFAMNRNEWHSCRLVAHTMRRAVSRHAARCVSDQIRVSPADGIWAQVKRARFGCRHCSRLHETDSIVDLCSKLNKLNYDNPFGTFICDAVAVA